MIDITYIPPQRQGILLLYSLIIGFITAIICGTIRLPADIMKKLLSNNNNLCIIIDVLFDVILSFVNIIVIIIFIYAANDGIIRFFMLFTAYLGILLYKISLENLYRKLAAVLSKAIFAIAGFIIKQFIKLTYPLKAGIKSRRVMRYIKGRITTAAGR